ncbi:hypothetical protein K8R78_06780 [bacterium]|nr:hypothetical protein [bacterium]
MSQDRNATYEALRVKKLFQKQLANLQEQVALWEKRLTLATEAGRADLVSAAQEKLDGLRMLVASKEANILEAERLLAEGEAMDSNPPVLTPVDRAELLKLRIDDLVGNEAPIDQELAELSKEDRAAAEVEKLKSGEGLDDLADL